MGRRSGTWQPFCDQPVPTPVNGKFRTGSDAGEQRFVVAEADWDMYEGFLALLGNRVRTDV